MDRGAWGATVRGVAKSGTQLSTHTTTPARNTQLMLFLLKLLTNNVWVTSYVCIGPSAGFPLQLGRSCLSQRSWVLSTVRFPFPLNGWRERTQAVSKPHVKDHRTMPLPWQRCLGPDPWNLWICDLTWQQPPGDSKGQGSRARCHPGGSQRIGRGLVTQQQQTTWQSGLWRCDSVQDEWLNNTSDIPKWTS